MIATFGPLLRSSSSVKLRPRSGDTPRTSIKLRVIAAEPSGRERALLERNIALNGLANTTVVSQALADAPGTAELFLRAWLRAGLPPSVLSVVHGSGKDAAGQFLVDQVEAGSLAKISFTGSTSVGRRIGEICGRNLQQPSLELGGKNPLLILADADIELAVDGALWASFGTAGQRCTSAGNIIVDRRVMPLVREKLVRR